MPTLYLPNQYVGGDGRLRAWLAIERGDRWLRQQRALEPEPLPPPPRTLQRGPGKALTRYWAHLDAEDRRAQIDCSADPDPTYLERLEWGFRMMGM